MNFSSSPCLVAASHRTIQFLFAFLLLLPFADLSLDGLALLPQFPDDCGERLRVHPVLAQLDADGQGLRVQPRVQQLRDVLEQRERLLGRQDLTALQVRR
jgi:hypothetical protein